MLGSGGTATQQGTVSPKQAQPAMQSARPAQPSTGNVSSQLMANPFYQSYASAPNASYSPYTATPDDVAMAKQYNQPVSGYVDAVNNSRQSQANQQRDASLYQMMNAYNTYAGQAGFDPTSGHTSAYNDQQQQIADQQAYYNSYYGLQRQGAQTDYATKLGLLNSANQANQQSQGINDRMKDDYQAMLANQIQGFQQGADVSNRQLTSQSTANDALQTQGARQGFTDIQNQLANQVEGAQKQRDINQARLDKENIGLQQAARDYGLNAQNLKNQLDQGLQNLGLAAYMKGQDIINAMNSSDAQDRQVAQTILNNAMQYGTQFPATAPWSTTQSSNGAVNGKIKPGAQLR